MLLSLILMMSSPSMAQLCPPPSTKYCGRLSDTASASGSQNHTPPSRPSPPRAAMDETAASNALGNNQRLSLEDEKLLTPAVVGVIRLVNAERAKVGLSALTFDPSCSRAAQDHAVDSGRNRLNGHVGSDGSQLPDRYRRYSSDFSMLSENWARIEDPSIRTLTPRTLVNSWMASPGHKANILDPTARRMGVGIYRAGAIMYGVQCFSAPAQ